MSQSQGMPASPSLFPSSESNLLFAIGPQLPGLGVTSTVSNLPVLTLPGGILPVYRWEELQGAGSIPSLFPTSDTTPPNLSTLPTPPSFLQVNWDALTGLGNALPWVGTSPSPSPAPTPSNPPILPALFRPTYAVMAEGTVSMNGGDFDGNPTDLSDDARIYAGSGFTLNGNPVLPVQRDANGNPVRDANGKLVLIDRAVTVAAGYSVSNATTQQYANLLPPQIVDRQTVAIPSYIDLRQQELIRRIPAGTATTTFNVQQNPINNASDWARRFPPAGTAQNPTVVRVVGGGLTIPANVNLSHMIITVEQGDINFNGNHHTFNNVMLVANNGNINLASLQSSNFSAFASGSINMNGGARFGGISLLASSSTSGSITFNGATTTTDASSNLWVVSQGQITYNAATHTRGAFLAGRNFTYNGNSTLFGAIGAKQNVHFNGPSTVIANSIYWHDTTAPVVTVRLSNDTAPNRTTNSDQLTQDPTIAGTVTDNSSIVEFRAGLNQMPSSRYVNVLGDRRADGSFTFTRSRLEQINGGALPDGTYTLHLQAKDGAGNEITTRFTFVLDTTNPTPTVRLTPSSDSGQSNRDRITQDNTPTIAGTAEAGSVVQLFSGDRVLGQTVVDASGNWQFTTPVLADGIHVVSAISIDAAGNVSPASTPLILGIDSATPQLTLTTPTAQPWDAKTRLIGSVNGTGSPIVSLHYLLGSGSEISLVINSAGGFDQLIDLGNVSAGAQTLTFKAIDQAGNVRITHYNIIVNRDSAAPVIAASLDRDTAPGGTTNSDRITADPTLRGTVQDESAIAQFRAGFNALPTAQFVSVQGKLESDGRFTLTRADLEAVYGGILPDGVHTLKLQAQDATGKWSEVFEFTFTLDTTLPAPDFTLDAPSDSGTPGDRRTIADVVTLVGQTEPNASVRLEQTGAVVVANSAGQFEFTQVALALGNNTFTTRAVDRAGNEALNSTTLYRYAAPIALELTGNTVAENSVAGSVIGSFSTTDPDSGDRHTYTLVENAGGRFRLQSNQLVVAPEALLDFEQETQYQITVQSIDSDGASLTQTFSIGITNVNEAPRFTSTPVVTGQEGSPYRYTVTTIDPDQGDSRRITATNLPSWLTLTDNGDGTATLQGTAAFGSYNLSLLVTDRGGLSEIQPFTIGVAPAPLVEGTRFTATRTIPVTLPSGNQRLQFRITPQFDGQDLESINDAFEVALVDRSGKSIVHTIGQARDVFLNWTEDEPIALGAGTTYDAATRTVTVNLSGIPSGTEASLVFRLVNNDRDIATQVLIEDLALTPAPAGAQPPLQSQFENSSSLPRSQSDFDRLQAVTSSIQTQYRRTSFNADTRLLYADLALNNAGTYSLSRTVLVAISQISDPSVTVRTPDGFTPDGTPYYDFSALLKDGKLNPSGTSEIRSLVFHNPNGVQFTYQLMVLAELNQNPIIESQPPLQVVGGQPYRYDVNAIDPDLDASLTYHLTTAPSGMAIDSASGVITWNTAGVSHGNYSVTVETRDSQGGVGQQQFTIAVTPPLPNRPPLFVTNPVVDAYIGQLYQYDADAIDPDQQPLNYSLIVGPSGMTINPETGMVQWTPPPTLVLGDTVLGRASIPGENDEFVFSGRKGQRIFLDPLQHSGSADGWNLDVYSPSGQLILDNARLSADQGHLLTLDEDGNYRIVVDAQGDRTGTYGFSVIASNLLPDSEFNTVISDRLSVGTQDHLYRFTGHQGQKIYLDALSNTGNLSWVLYNPSNAPVGSFWGFNDTEIDLTVDGEYILAVRGNSPFSSQINYALSIVSPEITSTRINAERINISGTLEQKGAQANYLFTGTAGQQFFFDALSGNSPNIGVAIFDPNNRQIFSTGSGTDQGPDRGLTLSTSGTYRIFVDGSGETIGNYNFRLLDRATAPLIDLNTDLIGQWDNNANGSQAFRFNLSDRTYVYLDAQAGAGAWLLYAPNGQFITSGGLGNGDREQWLDAGEYLLVMQGYGAAPNYRFQVVTPTLANGGQVSSGQVVSGTLSQKGARATHTFIGTAGQQLFYNALLGNNGAINVTITDPNGQITSSGRSDWDRGPDAGLVLSTSGVYRIEVDGSGETTGAYRFQLLDKAAVQPVALNTDITGTFDPATATSQAFRFSLSDRTYVYFDAQVGAGAWLVYGPNGQLINSAGLGNGDREQWLDAGEYLLVMQGYGTASDYRFQIVTPTLTNGGLTSPGQTLRGILEQKGAQATYTFTGTAGQQFFYDALLGSNPNIQVTFFDPSNRQIFSVRSASDGGPDGGLTLSTSGTYRILVDGSGETVGDYHFRLLDKGTAPSIGFNTSIAGTLDAGATSSQAFRFNLAERTNLYFDAQGGDGNWLIYAPDGRFVTWGGLANGDRQEWLNAGEYLLVVQGTGSSSAYQFQLNALAQQPATASSGDRINIGQTVSGSIATAGTLRSYTFTASAGQQLFYDGLGGNGVVFRLYSPTEQILFNNTSSAADRGPDGGLTLSTTGVYRLEFGGSNWWETNTGTYRFRLLDRAAAPLTAPDQSKTFTFSGSYEENVTGSRSHRFSLSERTYVYIDPQAGHGNWMIYGANGQSVSYLSPSSWWYSDSLAPDGEQWLEAGDYWLVAQATGTPTNYRLQISAPEQAQRSLNIGSVVAGSLSQKGARASYTFTGIAGQQLFYDALSNTSSLQATLYDPTGRQITRFTSNQDRGPDNGLVLTMNGSYRLEFDAAGEAIGDYRFRLLDRAAAVQATPDQNNVLSFSGSYEENITGSRSHRFSLSERTYVYIDPQVGHGNWIIYGANGQPVSYLSPSNWWVYSDSLAPDGEQWLEAGDYWMIAQAIGTPTSYRLQISAPELKSESIAIGSTVRGALSEKGARASYTFTGTAGQQLFYDALGSTAALRARLFDPTGREVAGFISNQDQGPDRGFTLLMGGTYRIEIDGDGEAIGNYGFRLLDRASASTIIPDQNNTFTISGSYDESATGSRSHCFSLSERTYIYADPQVGGGSWLIYGANGQLGSALSPIWWSPGVAPDSEFWLEAGDYWLVAQAGGANADYRLQLITPQFQTTAIRLGQLIDQRISEPGERDRYTFEGTAGQRLYFDNQISIGGINVTLIGPTGRTLFTTPLGNGQDLNSIVLQESGIYQITVDADADRTGNYRFRLSDYAAGSSTPTPIVLGDRLSGQANAGTLDADLYRFTSSGDQWIYVDTISGEGRSEWWLPSNSWQIYGPNGQIVQDGTANLATDRRIFLDAPGQYTLVVSRGGAANPNYEMRLNGTITQTIDYTLGTAATGNLINKGDQTTYTFTGSIGQQLFFDALSGSANLNARLYSPTGLLVSQYRPTDNSGFSPNITQDWISAPLIENGAYRLVIEGNTDAIGDYSFNLNAHTGATALTLGSSVNGVLPGDSLQLYQFNGVRGQQMTFDLLNVPTWSGANWILYDPNGRILAAPTAQNPDFTEVLPSSGTYTLGIWGSSSTPVNYRFQTTSTSTSPVTAVGLNQIQTGKLSVVGERDTFTFTAAAGTQILFDGLAQTGWQGVQILAPNGEVVFNSSPSQDSSPIVLQQSGTYQVQVFETWGGNGIGDYSFRILEIPSSSRVPGANYLDINSPVSGTLANGAAKIYTFEVTPGLQVLLNGMVGEGINAALYDPNGNLVLSQNNFRDSDSTLHTLTQRGSYQLVLSNAPSAARNYSFQLLDFSTAPNLNYGIPVQGSLTNGQQSFVYTFDGKADEKLYFDSIRSNLQWWEAGQYRWKLYGPGNQLLRDAAQTEDFELTLPQGGKYALYIQGGPGTAKVDYRFRVFAQTEPAENVIVPSSGLSAGNSSGAIGILPVEIEVRDVQGAIATQNYTIRLWSDPDNAAPRILSTPATRVGLNTGRYTYQVQAADPDGDRLTYQLLEAPAGAVINSETGEIFWIPEAVQPGAATNFTVQASDGRGGSDLQAFTVIAHAALGKIQGAVFEDINRNRVLDTQFFTGSSPNVVFAIDVSGSTGGRSVDWTKTRPETLSQGSYSILDMEFATVLALSEQLIHNGLGQTSQIGIVLWDNTGGPLDMNPAEAGIQLFTTALADHNNNGIRDLQEVLNNNFGGGGTNFNAGLIPAKGLVDSLNGDARIIFMSDGFGALDEAIVTQIREAGIGLKAFGIGAGANLEQLKRVDPNALQITDVDELVDIFSGLDTRYNLEPFVSDIKVYLDLNDNGTLDANEPWQLTQQRPKSSFGETYFNFSFENLLPGRYVVRQVVASEYLQTTPDNAFVSTVTNAGETFTHLFGIHKVEAPANQNPSFGNAAPTPEIRLGDRYTFQFNASDPDRDVLRYDLPLAPKGMFIEPTTGQFFWQPTPDQAGPFTVIVRVQDGRGGTALQAFQGRVTLPNQSPIFTSEFPAAAQVQLGKTFEYQAKANDADGDALTFALVGERWGATIDAATGVLQWTPTNSALKGDRTLTIRVQDGKGGESFQTVRATVIDPQPNQSPVILSTPRNTIRTGSTFLYSIDAIDPDGDRLSYSLQNAPAGMKLENGLVSWTPSASQFGRYSFSLNVSDGQLNAVQPIDLWVGDRMENFLPQITSTPQLVTHLEREYQYNLSGTDADGDLLLWSLTQAPAGMVIDAKTGALRWQPGATSVGTHPITVQLTDSYGGIDEQTFTLQVNGTNLAPTIRSTPVTLGAQDQAYSYQIVATDPENDAMRYSLGRRPTGMTIDAQGMIRWTPLSSQLGMQSVEVLVTDTEGATSSQRFEIVVGATAINQSPSILSSPIATAQTGQPYLYRISATDPDGDALTYRVLSGPTGIQIRPGTNELVWDNPIAGSHPIVIGVEDGRGLGAAQGFTLIARSNSAPTIRSTPIDRVTVGTNYAYDVIARDADPGDRLSYSLNREALEKGITIDALGRIRWTPTAGDITPAPLPITVTVTDTLGATATQQINLNVVPDDQAPQLSLTSSLTGQIAPGTPVTFRAVATDNVAVAGVQLLINGQAVLLDAFGMATVTLNQGGAVDVKAIALDTTGNRRETSLPADALIVAPPNNTAPIISFNLSGIANRTITAATDILGSITDAEGDRVNYQLQVAAIDSDTFQTLFTGNLERNGVIVNQAIGKFDPSLLQNDTYRLRLIATDEFGSASIVEDTLGVAGELKLGNFRLSFTDLAIPVTGIPITLTRTYDTLTTGTSDDFGYGWRMEFRDTDLKTSLRRTAEQEVLGTYPGFTNGTRVYITLPGGKRKGFTFRPVGIRFNAFFGAAPEAALYTPSFVGDRGVTSTLTVRNAAGTYLNFNGKEYVGLNGRGFNPADSLFGSVYVLTTQDGVEYEIDAVSGDLLTVTDRNGNKLTYTDGGIFSSTGKQVTFERDAAGRIVSVKDPIGELIRYEYDVNGDLVSVTDREQNTTRMVYDTSYDDPNYPGVEDIGRVKRPHFLREIIDPLGRTGARSEYDENGRLTQMLDANGSSFKLSYDPASSIQRVKDALGYETIYEYDSRGNTITEIDALGGITLRTFDENNNLLSETNPEGERTTYTYDNQGNQITITDALGNTTYKTYDRFGQALMVVDAIGNTTKFIYDNRGNQTAINSGGKIIQRSIDPNGQVTSITGADGSITRFFYDSFGQVVRQVDALGNETHYAYDDRGNLLTESKLVVVNGSSHTLTTRWTYDSEGRITSVVDPAGNTTRHELDAFGNTIASIDPLGRRTKYRYDVNNRLVETIYADGTITRIAYDLLGREVAKTDELGRTTHFTYNALGHLIETILPDSTPENLSDNPKFRSEYDKAGRTIAEIDPRGNRTEYEYDDAGRKTLTRDALGYETIGKVNAVDYLTSETDALGRTTQFFFDEAGRHTKTVYADGTSISYTYNAAGLIDSFTDQLGRTTYTVWDALGRPIEVILPDSTPTDLSDNPKIRREYNALSQLLAETDPSGLRTEYRYDSAGRLLSTSDGRGTKTYTYDAIGNRTSETDALDRLTQLVYDSRNRLVETIFANGSRSQVTYDAAGNLITKTDLAGNITRYEYDAQNRLAAVIDALNQRTDYFYDLAGNLIQIEDANNHITRYEYDELNRRISTILPMGQRSTSIYDPLGSLISYTDFNNRKTRYEYDSMNRLVAKYFQDSSQNVAFSYTPTGQRQTVTDLRGTTTYTYDAQDRLLSKTEADGRFIRYTYDIVGNRASINTPEGTTRYAYDQFHRLSQVTDPDADVTRYTYDAVNNLIRKELPNDTVEIREYDSLNRLTLLKQTNSDETIARYRYTLDSMGNRTLIEELGGRQIAYTYDALYRVIRESVTDFSQGDTTLYAYDPVGNRLSKNNSILGLVTYAYDGNDRLLTETIDSEVTQYTYDDNGNLLSKVKSPTEQVVYQWNDENRLVRAEVTNASGTRQTTYQYDGNGIRISSTVDGVETRYLVDENRSHAVVLEEYQSNGDLLASYVYGLASYGYGHDLISQEREDVRSFYHADGLGSIRLLTDLDGKVSDTYLYDAYGNLTESIGSTTNHYLYAGEQFDSGLDEYYLRARYYDPSNGRFISRDPFDGLLIEPLSLAKYPYVHGNPVNHTDPTGMYQESYAALVVRSILEKTKAPQFMIYRSVQAANALSRAFWVAAQGAFRLTYRAIEERVKQERIPTVVFFGGNLEEHAEHILDTQLGIGNTAGRVQNIPYRDFERGRKISLQEIPYRHPIVIPGFFVPVRGRDVTPQERDELLNSSLPGNNGFVNYARDEFPFSSTTQGGLQNWRLDRVSIRYVDRTESNRQGGLLSQFYGDPNVNLGPNSPWIGNPLFGRFGVIGSPFIMRQSGYFNRQGVWRQIGTPP